MIISVNQAGLDFYEMDGSGRMALSPKWIPMKVYQRF